jgi:hypothetical protein
MSFAFKNQVESRTENRDLINLALNCDIYVQKLSEDINNIHTSIVKTRRDLQNRLFQSPLWNVLLARLEKILRLIEEEIPLLEQEQKRILKLVEKEEHKDDENELDKTLDLYKSGKGISKQKKNKRRTNK